MTPEELKRARAGDLIVLPKGLIERCSNCKYLSGSECVHPKMRLPIADPPNMCCGYWDNKAIDRGVNLSASDNAGFDSHQTDPAKLAGEVRKDLHLNKVDVR